MQEEGNNKPTRQDDEIDLIELARKIWAERKLIVKTAGVFLALGLLVAFGSTVEYKSEARLLPELRKEEGGASGLISRFSGLAGIDLGMAGGVDAISPQLYPEVLKSTPFMLHLLNTRVEIPSLDTTATVYEYMTELKKTSLMGYIGKFTIGLPGTLMKLFRKKEDALPAVPSQRKGPIRITKKQYKTIKSLQDRIQANINKQTGIITVSVEFPDPFLAAQVAEEAVDYLQEYITGYRTTKAANDLAFIREQHDRAREDFEQAQQALAAFRDRNRNVISARAQSEEERLQAEYNLAFNVYNSLAQQLEQARIKVQEETPVFQVLDPVEVPVEKSKPAKIKILIITALIGVLLGMALVYFKYKIQNIKEVHLIKYKV